MTVTIPNIIDAKDANVLTHSTIQAGKPDELIRIFENIRLAALDCLFCIEVDFKHHGKNELRSILEKCGYATSPNEFHYNRIVVFWDDSTTQSLDKIQDKNLHIYGLGITLEEKKSYE